MTMNSSIPFILSVLLAAQSLHPASKVFATSPEDETNDASALLFARHHERAHLPPPQIIDQRLRRRQPDDGEQQQQLRKANNDRGRGGRKKPTKPDKKKKKKQNKPDKKKKNKKPKPKPARKPSSPSANNFSTDKKKDKQKPKPANRPSSPPPPSDSKFSGQNDRSTANKVYEILDKKKSQIDNGIFLYQGTTPSEIYRYDGFISGLRIMVEDGVANKHYYLGDDSTNGHLYGLANIAAFIGQSMKETIQYDACDENNWDFYFDETSNTAVYPLSNACGQLGQDYQDYHCPKGQEHMECEVDRNMEITGTTNAKWYGAPGPFFCGPRSKIKQVGVWDYTYACNDPWADPPRTCSVYEGQKAGRYDNSEPVANGNDRTDVEGCCWWGRGVIQTTAQLLSGREGRKGRQVEPLPPNRLLQGSRDHMREQGAQGVEVDSGPVLLDRIAAELRRARLELPRGTAQVRRRGDDRRLVHRRGQRRRQSRVSRSALRYGERGRRLGKGRQFQYRFNPPDIVISFTSERL